jgi:hypothetical protein
LTAYRTSLSLKHNKRLHNLMHDASVANSPELAAERDRVAAGLEDYAPDDVPPAADPPPPGVSEAVDLAERGLWGDTSIDTPDR